jgi:hypothetical protein
MTEFFLKRFKKSFTDDELIAFVKYPLPPSLFEGKFIEEWIPLNGKLGEQKEGYISIQLLLTVNYFFSMHFFSYIFF